jgi:tetratricopeptide (TPR) repeat protein
LVKIDSAIWYNRGIALRQLNKLEASANSYNHAIKLKPDDSQCWYNLGFVFNISGKHTEAIVAYEKVIAIDPNFHQAWYNKACSYAMLANSDLALQNLKTAIKLNITYKYDVKSDTSFDKIRDDKRFQALING